MVDRIDHAQAARRLVGSLAVGASKEERNTTALIHATLALVEQQRIGNLIAYVAQAQDMPDGEHLSAQELDYLGMILAQIREGLGIS